jgi:hypothetical protein
MTAYESGDGSAERSRDGGDGLGEVAHHAREQLGDAAQHSRDRLGGAVDPLREKMRKIADQQKDAGAEQMESIARAVHGAADDLERELPMAADYIHQAASRIEQASTRVRNGNVDELMGACTDFARQRPAAFFGGAVLAGFALARFLKSSGSAPDARRY